MLHNLWKIARAVYDVEEATFFAFEIILEHKVDIFPIWLCLCGCMLICIVSLCSFSTHDLYACSADDQTTHPGFTY
jgi:hypothetical protein